MSLNQLRDLAEGGQDLTSDSPTSNHYCLDGGHDPRLLTENRFFYWDMDQPGCPVCPVCQKQVNSQWVMMDAKGRPMIPASLLALSSRIGEPV